MPLAPLNSFQLRVLGSLVEKEIATPENYPLSLNALIGACNQRSSRDPVLDLTEEQVRQALHTLEDLSLVAPLRDARVPKYEHRLRTVLNLRRDETAILCLLMLRGPQTPGELRSRADRLYTFDGLDAVVSTLDRLAARKRPADTNSPPEPDATGPLTVMLPRQPGSREHRYAHLLGDSIATEPIRSASEPLRSTTNDRVDNLPAAAIAELESRIHTEIKHRIQALEVKLEDLQARIDRLEASASGSSVSS